MNERIRELLLPHLCRTEYDNGESHECYEFSEEEIEMFVESIVLKCIKLCDGNHEYKNHTDTLFGKGVSAGIEISKEQIKNHFGIKE